MGLAAVTVCTTAGGARISVPALVTALIESGIHVIAMDVGDQNQISFRSFSEAHGFGGIEINYLCLRPGSECWRG